MKKYLLYSLFAASAFTLASCDEDFNEGVAEPQSWPQEEVATLPEFSLNAVSAPADLATAGDSVTVFSMSASALPEGTTIDNIRLTLTAQETAATRDASSLTINASIIGKVATADLQAAIEALCGKRPVERTLVAEVLANLVKDGQSTLLTCPSFEIKAIPEAPQISQNYYLIGAPSAWEPTCVDLKFNHSGKDVYEDSQFTIVFPVEDGEIWFAITDDITVETNDWSNVFGCVEGNGLNAEEGKLARRSELPDEGSFKVVVDGDAKFIKVTLNMMEYTYKIEKLNFAEFIYVPGNHQGWNPAAAQALRSPNFDGVYTGYAYLNGNFKFTKARDWSAEYNFNDFTTMDDIFFNDDGSNINISEEGFYQIVANVAEENLSATKTTWGVIGDATADGWNSDQDMAWNAEKACWTATLTLGDGTIKFRANDDWAINVGGTVDDLTENGGDIAVIAGTYLIELYLERTTSEKMYCTLTAQ